MKYCRHFCLLLVLFVHFSFAEQSPNSPVEIAKYSNLVKVGDWIFRKGVQIDSLVVNQVGAGDFSHIGMIIAVEPDIKIIHATTDDDHNRPNQVIVSTLAEFISPQLAEKYAIARPNFLSVNQKQQIVEDLLSQQGAPFILSSRDRNHLYCTTLLADAIIKYQPDFNVQWQYVDFPLVSGDYLFPNAFAEHSDITWIYRYPATE